MAENDKVKVLFLDIDGVLRPEHPNCPTGPEGLHKRLLQNLALVVAETDCVIVLSSNWRLGLCIENPVGAHQLFLSKLREFKVKLIDCTPELPEAASALLGTSLDFSERSYEILQWLRNATVWSESAQAMVSCRSVQCQLLEVESFAVVDDKRLHKGTEGHLIAQHFVQTQASCYHSLEQQSSAESVLCSVCATGDCCEEVGLNLGAAHKLIHILNSKPNTVPRTQDTIYSLPPSEMRAPPSRCGKPLSREINQRKDDVEDDCVFANLDVSSPDASFLLGDY